MRKNCSSYSVEQRTRVKHALISTFSLLVTTLYLKNNFTFDLINEKIVLIYFYFLIEISINASIIFLLNLLFYKLNI